MIAEPDTEAERICIDRGYAYTHPVDYALQMLEGGTIEITDYSGSEVILIIPEEIAGYPVSFIGANTFSDRADVTAALIPQYGEQIDDTAFDQSALSVYCSAGSYADAWAQDRGYDVPACCAERAPAYVAQAEPTCTLLDVIDGVRCGACGHVFTCCDSIPAHGHELVPAQRLHETTKGTALEIPVTLSCGGDCGTQVYWIGTDGEEMKVLDSVIVSPADTVGGHTLTLWLGEDRENAAVCGVIVHSENPLMHPSALLALDIEAFAGSAVQAVILPDGAHVIDECAFARCASLVLITISDTVTSIADDAFEGSSSVAILCKEESYAAF